MAPDISSSITDQKLSTPPTSNSEPGTVDQRKVGCNESLKNIDNKNELATAQLTFEKSVLGKDRGGDEDGESVAIPDSWAKHNWVYQGFAKGEIEKDRPKSARCISWAVHYAENENAASYIYFFAHGERYGGPYGFLSNYFEATFEDPDLLEGHTFTSVEQYYQYCKCLTMSDAPERSISGRSSKTLKFDILRPGRTANQIAQLGRTFTTFRDSAGEQDRVWYEDWNEVWSGNLPRVMKKALRLKFQQNPDLMEKLLMTGDFVLAEASENDSRCGIGKSARKAIVQPGRWKGLNLLGTYLMEVRDELRAKHVDLPHHYAYTYWREYEDFLAQKRLKQLTARGISQYEGNLRKLQQAWREGPKCVSQYTMVPQYTNRADSR